MVEAVFRMGSRKVDGSSWHSASGHGTQVLLGAIHVDDLLRAIRLGRRNSIHIRTELGDQVLGRHDVDRATR